MPMFPCGIMVWKMRTVRIVVRVIRGADHKMVTRHSYFFPVLVTERRAKVFEATAQSQSRLRPGRRLCCLNFHGVDVRHATSLAFKDIKVGQVPKSRRCSSEPHKLSAAWAMRRPARVVLPRRFV